MTPDLAAAIGAEAARAGMSVRAWMARTIEQQLIIERGLRAMHEWQLENGAFTDEERVQARAALRDLQSDEGAL